MKKNESSVGKISDEGEFFEGKLWFQKKKSILTLGITGVGLEEVGSIQSIEFPEIGDEFIQEEVVARIEETQGSLELTTPLQGVIFELNSYIKEDPDRLSEDPVEEGWLVKVEVE